MPVGKVTRAKEHVLKRSWLRDLGHDTLNMAGEKMRGTASSRVKDMPADQILTGEVCSLCNNGWMNQLDQNVEDIIMSLAKQPGTVDQIQLSQEQGRLVARWLLKTACTYEFTDSKYRRHIPRSILSRVREPNYLPDGFLAFVMRSSIGENNLEINSLDVWPGYCAEFPQSMRLKFAVRYDNVVLGCCYWLPWKPTFVLTKGYQQPITTNAANYRFGPPFEVTTLKGTMENFAAQVGRAPNITDLALMSVDLDPAPATVKMSK